MDVIYTRAGASIWVLGIDEPGAVVASRFGTQKAHIYEALDRVPVAHLVAIPKIVVGDRPSAGGAFVSAIPAIRLNRNTFGVVWNQNYLFTLLHEIGHAVDHRRSIVTAFIRRTGKTGAEWADYRAIEYRGRNRIRTGPDAGTPAYGEHFAEGYAHLLTRPSKLTGSQQALIRRLAGM